MEEIDERRKILHLEGGLSNIKRAEEWIARAKEYLEKADPRDREAAVRCLATAASDLCGAVYWLAEDK